MLQRRQAHATTPPVPRNLMGDYGHVLSQLGIGRPPSTPPHLRPIRPGRTGGNMVELLIPTDQRRGW